MAYIRYRHSLLRDSILDYIYGILLWVLLYTRGSQTQIHSQSIRHLAQLQYSSLVFKRLVDTHQNQYARESQHAVYPVNDDVHGVIIPGLNRFYMSEQGFAMSELGGLIVFDRIINLTDIFQIWVSWRKVERSGVLSIQTDGVVMSTALKGLLPNLQTLYLPWIIPPNLPFVKPYMLISKPLQLKSHIKTIDKMLQFVQKYIERFDK